MTDNLTPDQFDASQCAALNLVNPPDRYCWGEGPPTRYTLASAAYTDDAAQFKLPQPHRQHDGMAAFGARHRAKRWKVAGNENFRFTPAASDHAQRFVAHESSI